MGDRLHGRRSWRDISWQHQWSEHPDQSLGVDRSARCRSGRAEFNPRSDCRGDRHRGTPEPGRWVYQPIHPWRGEGGRPVRLYGDIPSL